MNHHSLAHASRARTTRRGFSLLELVVIIVIAAIVSVVAVGASGNVYQSRQRAAGRQLTSDLQYLRERAMTTGRKTWGAFATTTNIVTYTETIGGSTFAVTDPITNKAFTTPLNTASDGQAYYGVKLGTIGGATGTITIGFDWLGRPLTGAGALQTTNQVVTITAAVGSTTFAHVTVTIVAESGLIFFTP